MQLYETGNQLADAEVISGFDGTVESAVTKLMYLKARYQDSETIRKEMQRSIAGEISV